MSSEKTLAIILKAVDFSETSSIITLFTQTSGRISGLAKGAHRPKGPFHGAIDVLSISQVLFLPRKSANLDLLTEAKLVRRFRPCQWSLARLYSGYYVAELLLETLQPHSPFPELFQQTIRTLNDLQVRETDWEYLPASAIVMRFEMQLLNLLGQGLELGHCGLCGKPLNLATAPTERTRQKVQFSFLESCVICSHCSPGKRQLFPVSHQGIGLLRSLQQTDDQGWRQQADVSLDTQLRDLLDQHWRVVLDRKLKLQPAVRQILSRERPRKPAARKPTLADSPVRPADAPVRPADATSPANDGSRKFKT